MNRVLNTATSSLAVVLCLMSGGIAAAQEQAPPSGQQAEEGTFQCKENKANRGEMRVGQPLEHTFRLLNTSSETRHIVKVTPGCGCTKVVDYPKEVAPQAWGEVKLAFNITGSPGQRQSSVLVETDDPKQPRLNLIVSCRVLPAIEMKPQNLQFVPEKAASGFDTQTIEVTGLYSDEKISIGDMQPSDPMISVTKETIEEQKRFRVTVTVSKDMPAGNTFANLIIPIEGSAQKSVRLPVTITNEVKVKAEPAVLELSADKDALQSAEFIVKAQDDQPLEVTKVELAGKELPVEPKRLAGNAVAVRLEDIKMTCGMNLKHIVVSTNHGELRVPTTIRSSCTVKKALDLKSAGAAGPPKT